jgi:hypothetical protein
MSNCSQKQPDSEFRIYQARSMQWCMAKMHQDSFRMLSCAEIMRARVRHTSGWKGVDGWFDSYFVSDGVAYTPDGLVKLVKDLAYSPYIDVGMGQGTHDSIYLGPTEQARRELFDRLPGPVYRRDELKFDEDWEQGMRSIVECPIWNYLTGGNETLLRDYSQTVLAFKREDPPACSPIVTQLAQVSRVPVTSAWLWESLNYDSGFGLNGHSPGAVRHIAMVAARFDPDVQALPSVLQTVTYDVTLENLRPGHIDNLV